MTAEENNPPPTWEVLCSTSRENLTDENKSETPPLLDDSWLEQQDAEEQALRRRVQNRIRPRIFENEPNRNSGDVQETILPWSRLCILG